MGRKKSLAAIAKGRWRWRERYMTVAVPRPVWEEIERLASKGGMPPQALARAMLAAEVARLKRGGGGE